MGHPDRVTEMERRRVLVYQGHDLARISCSGGAGGSSTCFRGKAQRFTQGDCPTKSKLIMNFLRSILRWRSKEKIAPKRPEFKVIYRWTSLLPSVLSPYTYVFKISSAAASKKYGLQSGRRVREIIFKQLYSKNSFCYPHEVAKTASLWAEIIPSEARPATHRIEIGIIRKASGSLGSPFFSEYFCFDSKHKTSDRIAIQIAGFLADQLDEARNFDGAAIEVSRHTFWLMCVFAGWKHFKN